jgi:23S rRNA (adenine2503-C2)-methyltransferase
MSRKYICGLSDNEIFSLVGDMGGSKEHSLIISNAIYKKGIREFSGLSRLPGKLRKFLDDRFSTGVYDPLSFETSADGTKKYLFRNIDGNYFETVFLPDTKRNTVCVSTQSGCRMGCPFCLTGRYGFHGDLSAGDIVNQVIALPEAASVTHVVFMGMGEPLDNIDNVLKACSILSAEWGKAVSQVNITVSTVGITPEIKRFLGESKCNLTISLFSPFAEERRRVVPAENKYPVSGIIEIMKEAGMSRKRRLSMAYVMINGVNDTQKHLEGLIQLLTGSGIRVNLLQYHHVPGDDISPSPPERIDYFKHNLIMGGISASIRKSRGEDISAACGLLAAGLNVKRLLIN